MNSNNNKLLSFKPFRRSPLSDDKSTEYRKKRKLSSTASQKDVKAIYYNVENQNETVSLLEVDNKALHTDGDNKHMSTITNHNLNNVNKKIDIPLSNSKLPSGNNLVPTSIEEPSDINLSSDSEDSILLDDDFTHRNFIPPEVLYRFKNFSLFSDAPNSFFIALARSLRLVQYIPQEYIVKYGEPAKSMYWILRGTVGVTSTDGEAVYAELAAGSFFGEIGILFNRPRTATVVARTRVLLGILTKDALGIVLSDYPKIERIIRDEGQERLAMLEKRKRLSRMSLPAVSLRVSMAPAPFPMRHSFYNDNNNNSDNNNNDNNNAEGPGKQILNHSLLTNAHDQVPGPSLPPIASFTDHHINSNNFNLNQTGSLIDRKQVFNPIDNVDDSISTREFLCNLPIFTALPRDILHELALSVEVVRYRPMEYIFRKGDFGRDIFFIVYGEVEVINDNGILARLGLMKYFGEFSFLSTLDDSNKGPEPRSADIRTVTDCEVLVIKDKSLDLLCEKYPVIIENIRRTAYERIKDNDSKGGIPEDPSILKNQFGFFKKISWDKSAKKDEVNELDPIPEQITSSISGSGYVSADSSMTSVNEEDKDIVSPSTSAAMTSDVQFRQFSFSRLSPTDSNDNSSPLFVSSSQTNSTRNTQSLSSLTSTSPQLLTMPPMNPATGSLHSFHVQHKPTFQYMSHDHRLRLSEINNGRRRSSVLNTGPLPDSLVIKIFQFLDVPVLMRLSRVCRRWKQLIYLSNTLFTKLDLTNWCKDLDDRGLVQITNFVGSRPAYINVSNCFHITDTGFSYMINEIGIRGCIKELIMKNNWNISAMAIMDLSVAGRSLENLELSNCRKVKDSVIFRLIGYRNDYKFGCHILKELNLGYCKYLTDQSMNHIANNANDRLVSLDLTRCTTITDQGYLYWSGVRFPNLKKLVLRDCTFLSDRVIEILSTSCQALEELDLTFCCMLTDISLKLLSIGCKKLVKLNFSFCGAAVSDYSLYELTKLKHLKELYIKGCIRVTREGVDVLLTKVAQLEILDLSQCSRVNVYQGRNVEPFDKSNGGGKYCCLKIKPHGNIIKVIV